MLRVLPRALLLLPALLVSACRYNFVPLIPTPVEVQLPTRLTEASLIRQGQVLVARASVQGRFQPGFLTVRWYNGGELLGTDSVYLDDAQRSAEFHWTAPQPGAYRAVLSFDGVVLRQVELYEVKP